MNESPKPNETRNQSQGSARETSPPLPTCGEGFGVGLSRSQPLPLPLSACGEGGQAEFIYFSLARKSIMTRNGSATNLRRRRRGRRSLRRLDGLSASPIRQKGNVDRRLRCQETAAQAQATNRASSAWATVAMRFTRGQPGAHCNYGKSCSHALARTSFTRLAFFGWRTRATLTRSAPSRLLQTCASP